MQKPVILQPRRFRTAFTLLELLISIGIIGVLAGGTIVAINPQDQLNDSQDARRNAYAKELKSSIIQYTIDNNGTRPGDKAFPVGEENAIAVCEYGTTDDDCINMDVLIDEGYMADLFDDPASNDTDTGFTVFLNGDFADTAASHLGESPSSSSGGSSGGDTTAPTVSTLNPADNATGVSVTANLVMTFSEAVDPESGASNDITIKTTSGDTTIETIDAQDAKVTGGGTTTITINPAATLSNNTEYYVLVGADAFDDAASNSYAGISSTTAWSFTTEGSNPTVTDGNISIAGGTGTAGAYVSGDTITVTWDNSASGDNNAGITAVTADLSGWGGSSTATMTDTTTCSGTADDDVYEACYSISAGAIDTTGVNASVTATNGTGPTTTSDTTGAVVDNQPPSITANGTLTITTDNSESGIAAINGGGADPDQVTQSAVTLAVSDSDTTTIDLSGLTGQSSLSAGVESGDVTAGSLDGSETFQITVIDNAGNATMTTSDAIVVDNIAPTVTAGCISVTGASGTSGAFKNGDTPTLRWDNSNPGSGCTDNNSDETVISFNGANFKSGDTARSGSESANVWTASLSGAQDSQDDTGNNITVTVTDDAGNVTATTGTNDYTVDTTVPSLAEVTPVPDPTTDDTPDYTFSSNEAGTITYGGDCSSGTTAASNGNNTVTFNSLGEGTHSNCTVIVTDDAGNASSTLNVTSFEVNLPPMSGWNYYKVITIDEGMIPDTGDLTNFPLLISTTDTDLRDEAQSDGDDIAFTSSDGETQYDHELEKYDNSSGEMVAWVEIPTLNDNGDTTIRMYYGNSGASNQQDVTGTWNSNFQGVWHMDEETAGTGTSGLYEDATSNNNDGDDYISDTGQGGKIGDGKEFDDADDYINAGDVDLTGGLTISAWVNFSDFTTIKFLPFIYEGTGCTTWPNDINYGFDKCKSCGDGNEMRFFFRNSGSWYIYKTSNAEFSTDTWHHIAVTYDESSDAKFYQDGVLKTSSQTTGSSDPALTTTNVDAHIRGGDECSGNNVELRDKNMDEFRMSNTARSAGWVTASYNNQVDQNDISIGSEQSN